MELCAHGDCGKPLHPPLLRCARCKKEAYCSKDCQKKAWKGGHKWSCGVEQRSCEVALPVGDPVGGGDPVGDVALPVGVETEQAAVQTRDAPHDPAADATNRHRNRRSDASHGRAAGAGSGGISMDDLRAFWRLLAVPSSRSQVQDTPEDTMAAQSNSAALMDGLGDATAAESAAPPVNSTVQRRANASGKTPNLRGLERVTGAGLPPANAAGTAGGNAARPDRQRLTTKLRGMAKARTRRTADNEEDEEEASAARGLARATAALTPDQMNLMHLLDDIIEARDWPAVTADREIEAEARAVAATLRVKEPHYAGIIYSRLAVCFQGSGMYTTAAALYEESRAICKETGDLKRLSLAVSNLGLCFQNLYEHEKAIALFEEDKEIMEETGNRGGVGWVLGNIALSLAEMGQNSKATRMFMKSMAISEKVGDKEAVCNASCNLAECLACAGEYAEAVRHFKIALRIANELRNQSKADISAMGVGVMLRLQVLAEPAADPAALPEYQVPMNFDNLADPLHLAMSAKLEASLQGRILDPRLIEAIDHLGTALAGGQGLSRLHLAHAFFDAGLEDSATGFLGQYLARRVKYARTWCGGCGQTRSEDSPMLTCGGCGVVRFCSAEHQKMASKREHFGRSFNEKHKDMCGLLGKWRSKIVKDGLPEEALKDDMIAYLREKNL